jgi:BASS family bile acid:Na+ symporter
MMLARPPAACQPPAAVAARACRALAPLRAPLRAPRPARRPAAAAASPAVAAAAAAAPTPAARAVAALAAAAEAATNLFPLLVLGAAALGAARPAAFAFFPPAAIAPALGLTMLGMGLSLTVADLRRVAASPGRVFAGFCLQFSIMPALAWALARALALPLDLAVGLCLVGCAPGGTASNVVTFLARADVPLSVAMTTASTLGAVVMTPLLTSVTLGTLVPVDAAALLASTLQVVLLPVAAGAALNRAFPRAVAAAAPAAALAAVSLIAAICGSVVARSAGALAAAGPRLLAALALLHGGGFALGYAGAKAFGFEPAAARATSIEVGMQNSALGALLATQHFAGNPLAAMPCALSATMHSVMGSLLAAFWRWRDDAAGAAAAAAPKQAPEPDADARRQAARRWIAAWRAREGLPGAPSRFVTLDEVAAFSDAQLAFLERQRREREERGLPPRAA